MLERAKRHKKPRTLNEPFRSFREIELAIERARASYCFFQHKVCGRSLRDLARELGMSYERIRHLSDRAEKVYGLKRGDYLPRNEIQTDVDGVEGCNIMNNKTLEAKKSVNL